MDFVAGQKLGRYEIMGYLGAGGMGVVYRARDSQLGRDVAVKVLNDRAAARPSRIERFSQEARAVARLSHPNILDIHDFGTEGKITYAVTELLQGQTLADRIEKGPVPLSKALDICAAIADGLAAAHGEGIVHRDIKPSNIFITDTGQVKILDFGIARLRELPPDEQSSPGSTAPTESLTGASRMVGTVGYMSPEQIDGGNVDGRSDIFGLGCVIYEVLTGKRAFRGKTSTDTMLAILGKDPEPIRGLSPEVPQPIALIVERCLEKQPGERFESARDVAFALRAMSQPGTQPRPVRRRSAERVKQLATKVAAASVAFGLAIVLGAKLTDIWPSPPPQIPGEKHMAVIPFEASEGGTELAQFAAGLTEILASDLALLERRGYGRIWTVPTGDARYMGASTVGEMYRMFDPNIAITGGLERGGSTVRLDIALADPLQERKIRSSAIEANLGNVSSFQLDPILRVVEMLELELKPSDRDWLAQRITNVAPAFDLYVRGRGVLSLGGDEGRIDLAIELLEKAVEMDPLFTSAREILAQAFTQKYGETGAREFFERAHGELQRIVSSQPSHIAYRGLGTLYFIDGQMNEAVAALNRALELDPEDSLSLFELGRAYERLGRQTDAENIYQRSINLRPGYWPGPNRLATLYYSQGRYDAAANAWREATEDAPLCVQGYNNLGAMYSWLGRLDEARRVFEESIEVEPVDNYAAYSNLGTLSDLDGRFADAVAMYEKALEIESGDYKVWGNYAFALTFSDQAERASEPFARAIELAEEARLSKPDDSALLSRLAGYYVMAGEHGSARELLKLAEALKPKSPNVYATIGETYEDLGNRDTALVWIGRALEGGVLPSHFERRPMLRDLISDERYRQFVAGTAASPTVVEEPSSVDG